MTRYIDADKLHYRNVSVEIGECEYTHAVAVFASEIEERKKSDGKEITICDTPIEEVIKILNGLELERRYDIKMTMENLSKWQEILRKNYEESIKKSLDESFNRGIVK